MVENSEPNTTRLSPIPQQVFRVDFISKYTNASNSILKLVDSIKNRLTFIVLVQSISRLKPIPDHLLQHFDSTTSLLDLHSCTSPPLNQSLSVIHIAGVKAFQYSLIVDGSHIHPVFGQRRGYLETKGHLTFLSLLIKFENTYEKKEKKRKEEYFKNE